MIDPAGHYHSGYPCYEHAPAPYTYGTLPDLLNSQTNPPISWKYYTPEVLPSGDIASGLWVAPIAIGHLCKKGSDNKCDGLLPGGQYANNMRYETDQNPYPIMDDIDACQLAGVSWAIPDKLWSDHGGEDDGSGPAYVADIVNAIGTSTCKDRINGQDYTYWQDTVIFIVWDDWGGWFDHVPPFKVGGQSNGWGASYTYGFRVPLLVVSAYTPAHYVSGAISGPPSYPPPPRFTHDFGSILAFTENNFGIPIGSIGPIQYPFADKFAPDNLPPNVPLADFFTLTTPRNFVPITVPAGRDKTYFQNYFANHPTETPDGPDANDD